MLRQRVEADKGDKSVKDLVMLLNIEDSARTPKPHVRLLSLVYDIYVTLLLYDLLRNTPVSALLQHCFSTV